MNKLEHGLKPGTTNGQVAEKFQHPDLTAKGEQRATVSLTKLQTLWINTGSLCNIECVNCYIESSPKNDRYSYISAAEAAAFFDETENLDLGTEQIGFTGGEPFLNPDMLAMADDALSRGLSVLILTNAMQPMQRKHIKKGLISLNQKYGQKLCLRVSLDHYTKKNHEAERGCCSWQHTLNGIDWLSENGIQIALAGRTCWHEEETEARKGYAELIAERGWEIQANNPNELVLFPEMDTSADVPEITTACWGILNVRPEDMMCATSRMVVKQKGDKHPTVLPCTLLTYDKRFEMGATLKEATQASGCMFTEGAVKLCHPHCAKFCVLGGGSCSA